MNSAPILPSHLRRKAVIYIRQSTGHQVMTNQESQRMQRDMKEHALRLGWPESLIEIVEADTGTSAQSTVGRTGYKNLLSELAMGEIGIVLSYESTRLSETVVTGIRCSICAH
jgi:DNA invertase Pin-like site-specific DNA recombinase